MGLNSCSSCTRLEIFSALMPSFSAKARLRPRGRAGGTRASGGSRKRIVAGSPFSSLNMPSEILALIGQQFGQRLLPVFGLFGENHLAHGIDAVALEEHVLGAAEADAGGAERDGVGRLLGVVGVGADLQARGLGAPFHELREILVGLALLRLERFLDQHLDDFRGSGLDLAGIDVAAGAVDGEEIAFVEGLGRRP